MVWKEGFPSWKKVRDVSELKEVFEEDSEIGEEQESQLEESKKKVVQEELVLDIRQEPPYILWILLVLISLIYVIIQLYH